MTHSIKRLTVFFLCSLMLGCSAPTASTAFRVAYLVESGGQLSETELAKHPEILVTHSYDEFKIAARDRIALWIDRNATQLVPLDWINSMPQASYPIFVIGYNNPILAFGKKLPVDYISVPIGDHFSGTDGGFSVFKRDSNALGAPVTMLQGFKQGPSVDFLLGLSNDLLDRKIHPTPMFGGGTP